MAVGVSVIPAGSPPVSAAGVLVVGQTVPLPYQFLGPTSMLFHRPPTAIGKSVVVKKNTATAVALKGTDPEGAALVYSVVDFPENGRLTGRAPNLAYKPDSGFVGTDAFTFTVSDGVTTSEVAAESVTVISAKAVVRRATKKK